MDIELLRKLVRERRIKWTAHCFERMAERGIRTADVKNCVLTGEVIEDYPNDYPLPSCLVFGFAEDGKAIHVVAGSDGKSVFIISACFPNKDKFEDDFMSRRK